MEFDFLSQRRFYSNYNSLLLRAERRFENGSISVVHRLREVAGS